MSDHQQDGIRLDLFERVQLHAQAAPIHNLEEIELIPNITVETKNEEASLRGELILQGSYIAKDDHQGENVQELYQTIPVDITLPMSRVTSLDAIAVQVEQFDVEVNQPRTIDVTGVLALNGIQLLPTQASIQSEPVRPQPIAEPIPIPVPIPEPPVVQPTPPPAPTPAPAPQPAPEPAPEPIEVELKRQLIRIEVDQRPTHTIRCCIVQKLDTWTDICNRYNKTLRELRMINRLNDEDELCEGQVIIIP